MLHQPSYMNGGWETVAEDLGFTHDQIRTYCTIASVQQHKTPGELMLRDWVDHGPGCTLFVLCNTLENVGRQDCLDYLRNEIYSKLKAYKMKPEYPSSLNQFTNKAFFSKMVPCHKFLVF